MQDERYNLLFDRLENADNFVKNNDVWKLSALNKYIKDHDARIENGFVTVEAKYRNSTGRVQLLKESDLDRVWRENHALPHLHADREKTIAKICTK